MVYRRKTRKTVFRKKRTKRCRKQRGGSWIHEYLSKAVEYQQLAKQLDQNKHRFFISGSTAILFYLNELQTVDAHYLTPADQDLVSSLLSQAPKPSDLDFKYIEEPSTMFETAVVRDPTKASIQTDAFSLSMNFSANIHTCPSYVNLGTYRACMPMEKDISFEAVEKDAERLFDSIDFTQIRPPRKRHENPDAFVTALYGGKADVMGIDNLRRMYQTNERPSNTVKLTILHSLQTLLSSYPDLLAKYNGTQLEKESDF